MGISIDPYSAGMLNTLGMKNSAEQSAAAAEKLSNTASSLGSHSTEKELVEATKSFETYFVEQILKEMKKSLDGMNPDKENQDMAASQMSDYYMDSTISSMAEELVEKFGGSFTDSLVDHMKLTYGIKDDSDTTALPPVDKAEDSNRT
ncbi:MAG: hypothetical protein IIU28_07245 [Lachnospiraceae bacterium]|nr:hypothetical protein [Lachnospiraceae bacterium]